MRWLLTGKVVDSFSFLLCRTHLSYERSAPFVQIDQRQHRKCAVGVFGEPAITNLGETPQALERQERMFDLGAHAGLASIGLSVCSAQGSVPVGTLVGEISRSGRNLPEPLALLLAPVGAVTVKPSLIAAQKIGQFLTVVHVASRDAGAVHQAALAVQPDMQLHAKVT